MSAPAIEASYRGYRFRSRLEARWAIAFDHMNLTWKYETQGYLIGPDKRPYLPDFWVRDFDAWVEVKGDPAALDHTLVRDAVRRDEGLPGTDSWGRKNLLILGDIPDPYEPHGWLHHLIWSDPGEGCHGLCDCAFPHHSTVAIQHFSQNVLAMAAKKTAPEEARYRDLPPYPVEEWPRGCLTEIGRDEAFFPRGPLGPDLVTARPCAYLWPDPVVAAAYRAARSARFEHGETPEPPNRKTPEPERVGDALRERISGILEARKRDR